MVTQFRAYGTAEEVERVSDGRGAAYGGAGGLRGELGDDGRPVPDAARGADLAEVGGEQRGDRLGIGPDSRVEQRALQGDDVVEVGVHGVDDAVTVIPKVSN